MATPDINLINKRRIFGIISHPDAGKTTLTEKLLLHGGAIHQAGTVKARKGRSAKSDWMEIEKQRGISVTSSVMQFEYQNKIVSIMDTPGHNDFGEDTYRILTSVDSAVMVIDAAKGVEAQTEKLFKVCSMRGIPIFTFINKMDLEARDPYELLEEIENVLGIKTCPINWPIGSGKRFKGVYDRNTKKISMFQAVSVGGAKSAAEKIYDLDNEEFKNEIGDELYDQLVDDAELLDGASEPFDQELVDKGELSPVFFGSALTTFGVETFLEHFLKMTESPLPRMSDQGLIDPVTEPFSGFVFKIQANMNKAHHDRIAFMRVCSGKFDASKEVYHVQGGKKMKLSQPQQIMAQDRKVINEAYAGDVIGVFDPGIFSIGDTICTPGKKFAYEGIPTFAPEHFCRLVALDSMKRKQFMKGVTQIAQEGAIQIFQDYNLEMSEIIVGVVGVLQFDVLKYRMENEYGCDVRLEPLPYRHIRWIKDPTVNLNNVKCPSDAKRVKDMKGNPLVIFTNEWSVKLLLERNEGLEVTEFKNN